MKKTAAMRELEALAKLQNPTNVTDGPVTPLPSVPANAHVVTLDLKGIRERLEAKHADLVDHEERLKELEYEAKAFKRQAKEWNTKPEIAEFEENVREGRKAQLKWETTLKQARDKGFAENADLLEMAFKAGDTTVETDLEKEIYEQVLAQAGHLKSKAEFHAKCAAELEPKYKFAKAKADHFGALGNAKFEELDKERARKIVPATA